jgi:hypothetical protein
MMLTTLLIFCLILLLKLSKDHQDLKEILTKLENNSKLHEYQIVSKLVSKQNNSKKSYITSNSIGTDKEYLSFGKPKDFTDDYLLNLSEHQFNSAMMQVIQINLRFGACIDQIQMILSDGIKIIESRPHGGNGGIETQYQVPFGHRITQIEVWSTHAIDALRFTTNNDEKSKIFGTIYNKISENIDIVKAPLNTHLIGIKGKNSSILNMISFVWFN